LICKVSVSSDDSQCTSVIQQQENESKAPKKARTVIFGQPLSQATAGNFFLIRLPFWTAKRTSIDRLFHQWHSITVMDENNS